MRIIVYLGFVMALFGIGLRFNDGKRRKNRHCGGSPSAAPARRDLERLKSWDNGDSDVWFISIARRWNWASMALPSDRRDWP